jgi:hypothetical protein
MNDCDMFRLLYMAGAQPQDKSLALPSTPHLSSPQPEPTLFLAFLSSAPNFSCCQQSSAKKWNAHNFVLSDFPYSAGAMPVS